MLGFLQRFRRHEGGATAIEYGLIITLIFLAILGAVQLFATNATNKFNTASEAIVSAGG